MLPLLYSCSRDHILTVRGPETWAYGEDWSTSKNNFRKSIWPDELLRIPASYISGGIVFRDKNRTPINFS